MNQAYIFTLFSCFLTGFSQANPILPEDQLMSIPVIESMGDSNEAITEYKKECSEIDLALKKRVADYLASTSEVEDANLNAKAVYSYDYEWIGVIGHPGTSLERINTCTVYLRLTSATKVLTVENSNSYYTGRGRKLACEKMKSDIELDPAVLFSYLNQGLFRCSVKHIVRVGNRE